MARDNDLAATVEGLVEAHGGHIDALTDLAADLATQARLPRCRIWEALAAYSAEAARRSLEGEPVAGAALKNNQSKSNASPPVFGDLIAAAMTANDSIRPPERTGAIRGA